MYGIHAIYTPLWGPHKRLQIVNMVYLVVTIIKLSHETLHTTVNDNFRDRGVLYRSKIDDDLDEISHTCHLGLGFLMVPTAINLVVWALWGEIKVDFDDLKHIVNPIGRCNELHNTTTYDLFVRSSPTCEPSRERRKLVPDGDW